MMATRLKAGLDKDGMPVALLAYAAGAKGFSVRGLHDGAYAASIIPNVHVTSEPLNTHFLTGPYRGPGYNSTAFFLETLSTNARWRRASIRLNIACGFLPNGPTRAGPSA